MAPHHGIWGTIQTMECKWISEIPRNFIQTSLSIIICEHMTYITDSQHIYRSFNFQWYQSLVAGALGQFQQSSKFLKSWHLTLGTAMRCPAGLWFQHFAVHFAICKSVQPWATSTSRKSWKCKMQRYWKSQVSQVSAPIRLEYQKIYFEASTFVNVRCWRRVSWPPILPALRQIDLIAPSWPQLFMSKDHSYMEQEIQMIQYIQIAKFSFNKARSSFQHLSPSLAHASPAKQQNI